MIIGNHRNVYKLADVIRFAAYDIQPCQHKSMSHASYDMLGTL